MAVFVGVDWGCGAHAICVIDARGMVLDRFEVGHDREGVAALITRLKKPGAPGGIAVAIERPSGLLVDALVEAGFRVTPIHPNVVKACRPRYRAVAAKSDPGNAFILADILRTDGHRLRPLAPQSDAIKARLGPKRLAGFLAQHQSCGRRSPEALLARLRSAPEGCAGKAESEAKGELVRARFPTEDQLAAEAGVAPVTYQSDRSRGAGWRWACNRRLRAALTCMADNSRHHSPWAADVDQRARARGCDHPHAIRILARAWARVLRRAWTNRQPYNPTKHTAAQPFLKPLHTSGRHRKSHASGISRRSIAIPVAAISWVRV